MTTDEFSDEVLDNVSLTKDIAIKDLKKEEELMRNAVELIPPYVRRIHGCMNCEWYQLQVSKGEFMCPHHDKKKADVIKLTGGICPRRAVYLLGFSKDPTAAFDYNVWQNDYNNAVSQQEYMKDVTNLQRIDARLDGLNAELHKLEGVPEEEQDVERINQVRDSLIRSETSRSFARRNWESLMEKISKNNAIALARTLAEQKLSDDRANNANLLRPSDIAKMINTTRKLNYAPNPRPREAEFVRDAFKEVREEVKFAVRKSRGTVKKHKEEE